MNNQQNIIFYGADHIRPSFKERYTNRFTFLNRIYNPPAIYQEYLEIRNNLLKFKENFLKNREEEN